MKRSVKLSDRLFEGARLPILIAALILVIVTVSVAVVWSANKPKDETVIAYVTVKGLGEDKDFENRQIKITDGDTVADIFSLKYKDIYEAFGQPFVQYNEFETFMGVRKTSEKSFHVTIDGTHDNNLSQAYVYGGQTIVISYY